MRHLRSCCRCCCCCCCFCCCFCSYSCNTSANRIQHDLVLLRKQFVHNAKVVEMPGLGLRSPSGKGVLEGWKEAACRRQKYFPRRQVEVDVFLNVAGRAVEAITSAGQPLSSFPFPPSFLHPPSLPSYTPPSYLHLLEAATLLTK